jgi:CheY-like chemotaxis protein
MLNSTKTFAVGGPTMHTLLVIDDDPRIRNLIRLRMQSDYEVIDTDDPQLALGFALERKPDAVLLDLMMPEFSGFELCQSLHSLSYTSRIPIFVVTGESGSKFRDHCAQLGALGYFEKPIDFTKLKLALEDALRNKSPERKGSPRIRIRVPLRLRGNDSNGLSFDEVTTTEDVSVDGFLCVCMTSLTKDAEVGVSITGPQDHFVGRARVTRKESPGVPWQKYDFQFLEKNNKWVLQ